MGSRFFYFGYYRIYRNTKRLSRAHRAESTMLVSKFKPLPPILLSPTWISPLARSQNQPSSPPQRIQTLVFATGSKKRPIEVAARAMACDTSAKLSGPWLWSWFLDIFAGYGKRPALAFIWSGLVVAIGAFVFRRKEDMLPTDNLTKEYDPIWYSFALFLPLN
jgi:hypothetical protein